MAPKVVQANVARNFCGRVCDDDTLKQVSKKLGLDKPLVVQYGDYMKGEYKLEQMKDPAYMYKIVSDERAYQTRLLFEWKKQIQAMPPGHPKAEELQARIKKAQAITTNLFKVLKRITGAEGSTGGTDFLSDKK